MLHFDELHHLGLVTEILKNQGTDGICDHHGLPFKEDAVARDGIHFARAFHLLPDLLVAAWRTDNQFRSRLDARGDGVVGGCFAGMKRNQNIEFFGMIRLDAALHKLQAFQMVGIDDLVDFQHQVGSDFHAFDVHIKIQALSQQLVQGKSEIPLPSPHVGDVDRAVELHRLDQTLHNLGILVYLLELVLHVRRDLAFTSGQAELIPPRVGRIDEAVFLLVVVEVLLAVFLHLLSLDCGFAFARNQQSDILVHGE